MKQCVTKDLFECDKVCDVAEYLDYKNFKCRKKLVDKLVDDNVLKLLKKWN